MTEQPKPSVYSATSRIVKRIESLADSPSSKANLAKIRRTVGKPLNEATEVWPILFDNLPEEFISDYGKPTYEEVAIYHAIQLYALYQQGGQSFQRLSEHNEDNKKPNIGYYLSSLRKEDSTTATDRRFSAMITSSTLEELVYHLRHMLNLLKSKSSYRKIDFAKLAEDLYWYQKNNQETVRLEWARSYYSYNN